MQTVKKMFEVGDTAYIPLVDTIVKTKIVGVVTRETHVKRKGIQREYFYIPDDKDIKVDGIQMLKYKTYDEAKKEQESIIEQAKRQMFGSLSVQVANVIARYGKEGADEIIDMAMKMTAQLEKEKKKAEKKALKKKGAK